MPKAAPKWKQKMPEFIGEIVCATSEENIRKACEEMKTVVVDSYPHTPNSRRVPMSEIREAVRGRFPTKLVDGEVKAEFPYCYKVDGKRRDKNNDIPNHRLEHLAIKYLREEWNTKPEVVKPETVKPEVVKPETVKPEVVKPETVKPEVVKPETVKPEVVKPELDILNEVGLTNDEVEQVKKALGESDVREWVRQAIMQRASAINNKKAVMDEDLLEVPSEILMNEKKYRTNPTAARELVNRAVRVVKQWNLDHPDQKWCITNKLIGELTGVTVKAIAKAVEGMDLESYNKSHDLTPVVNRMVKGSCGEASQVMSIANVTGIEGTEENYR
jgi:hypothetical protein